MVMKFTLTPLSHYNSITEPRARFLLSLLEDLFIDFPSHFITSILDVYLDIVTCDKLIFPSTITWILRHLFIPIPSSSFFTTMGAISVGSVWQSEAQLRPKPPQMETTDPAAFAIPSSSSAPSTSAGGGVTLEAIMAQLQRMEADFGARLDYLTNEMCQVNTQVGHIACRQAHMVGVVLSPSPSPKASPSEEDDVGDDKDDASSSGDDEMPTSKWLAFVICDQKGE